MVDPTYATWQGTRARDPRRLVLGTAQWGMPYGIANESGPPSAAELESLLRLASEAGIRTIDTARAYGESEARIGGFPGDWRVITKLAPDVVAEVRADASGPSHADAPASHGTSGPDLGESLERVAASLAASRAALGREELPVLLLHRHAHRHAFGGKLWRTLQAERAAGRIGQLGISVANPEEAWAALDDPEVEVLQVATSLLDLRLHRQGFFPRARETGRTVYVRSVFLQGVAHLGSARLPSFLAELAGPLRTIERFAADHHTSTRAVFLAFARELPGAHPVLGCETAAQFAQLLHDWQDETIHGGDLAQLVDALPTAPAALVDPSLWPVLEVPPPSPSPARTARTRTTRWTGSSSGASGKARG